MVFTEHVTYKIMQYGAKIDGSSTADLHVGVYTTPLWLE